QEVIAAEPQQVAAVAEVLVGVADVAYLPRRLRLRRAGDREAQAQDLRERRHRQRGLGAGVGRKLIPRRPRAGKGGGSGQSERLARTARKMLQAARLSLFVVNGAGDGRD